MAKRKKPAHLITLEKIEAHFENLKRIGFDPEGGRKPKVVKSIYFIRCSLELLSEMIIPKGAIRRVITRLIKMRDESKTIDALYDLLCKIVKGLEQRS